MSVFKVISFCVFFLLSSGLTAEEYKIVLTRPDKVGEKYHVSGKGELSENTKMTVSGQVLSSQDKEEECTIETVVEVLEIDKKKRASKLKLKIEKLTGSDKAGLLEQEILPFNSEVIVEKKGKHTFFFLDGEKLTHQKERFLSLFFTLPKGETTDDDILGTEEKKKVGDSWKINSKIAASDLALEGIKAEEKNIEGNTTLVKVAKVGKSEFLQLKSKMGISGVKLLPPEVEVIKSEMIITSEGLKEMAGSPKSFDPKWTTIKMSIDFVAEVANPNSPSMKMDVKATRNTEMTTKNLK